MDNPDDRPTRSQLSPLIVSYRGARPDPELLEWVAEGIVSGTVIFAENAPADDILAESIQMLRDSAGARAFCVMVDEEGGRVRRLADSDVSMPDLRTYESDEPAAVAEAYRNVAIRLRRLGIDTLLAPVIDVGSPRASWLRSRTYSDDAVRVAAMAAAVIPAVQNESIACCAKHFPGSRGVTLDTHLGTADDTISQAEWERIDALPFRAAVKAGVRMVMIGHQRAAGFDPVRPACLSPLVIRVLLRERIGFTGIVMTDDLAMRAISGRYPIESAVDAALKAGCDQVLICNDRVLQRRAVAFWRDTVNQPQDAETR